VSALGRTGGPPAVTVLVPAYNATAFIEETLRSALQQTFSDLEVLVIDDGSSDDTAARAAAAGDRVHVATIPHGGLAKARNEGLRRARGRYVLFLDADDLIAPDLAARSVAFLERDSRPSFVFTNLLIFHPDGRVSSPLIPVSAFGGASEIVLDNPLRDVLAAGYFISSSGLCARREACLEAGGFDETLWGSEDFEYWSRLYLRRPAGYLAAPLVRIRRHAGSMTRQPARMIPCMADSLNRVVATCRALGRPEAIPFARRYARRNMETAVRDLLRAGEGRRALGMLWRYRSILRGPRWFPLILIGLIPPFLLRTAASFKDRLAHR